jgi:pimeloyl-ACP methyl ester carboxylesterase
MNNPVTPSSGSLPDFFPTQDQIQRTQAAMDAYISSIAQHPDRRDGAYPYYRFHAPGQPIRGTVMIFHGFSAKPHQMWRLTDYLFENGFNVYQPSLAGHSLGSPARNWPQVDLCPEIADPLKAKVSQDPVLQKALANLTAASGGNPDPAQQAALLARLLSIEPRLMDIVPAIESPTDPDFERYFASSHMTYLTHALARLAELDALPGPIYTVGLSVGGAVALALAAARPDRVQRVVAYAPLLKVLAERRRYINLAGPLDVQEVGWDPALKFPIGCFTAADRFGSAHVLSADTIDVLKTVPTFLVLTENEDAADIAASQDFYEKIGGEWNSHRYYRYLAKEQVPHPMVDPTEVSQDMSNRFWQSLYQETLRFLLKGEIDVSNLADVPQNADLPQVAAVG